MQFTEGQQHYIDEHYQLLPKDADGEYIHIGDVMWQKDRITKRSCKAIMGSEYVMLDGITGAVYARKLTHYHAPTVEDTLHELIGKALMLSEIDGENELVAEYAKRLTLRGDAE